MFYYSLLFLLHECHSYFHYFIFAFQKIVIKISVTDNHVCNKATNHGSLFNIQEVATPTPYLCQLIRFINIILYYTLLCCNQSYYLPFGLLDVSIGVIG